MITTIFFLLVLFQIKHFLCDYIWQNSYMLGKFKDEGWVGPLSAHVAVHGLATFIIATIFTGSFLFGLGLAALDVVIHFSMDRIKASSKMLGRYNPQQKQFWWSLGLDQGVHHLTHYGLIFLIVTV